MQRKINDTVICLRMGKTYTAKTPPGDFKVTIPKTPLLSQQAVTSKEIPVSYTNLQLNPYPNTQLDLFCSDSSPFDAWLPSTWLTSCANPSTRLTSCANPSTRLQSPTKKVVGCKILQFIHTIKIKKMFCHKTLRCTYTATSSREKDELRQELRLRSQFA